jgi:hypothetical protein
VVEKFFLEEDLKEDQSYLFNFDNLVRKTSLKDDQKN